MTKIVNYFTYPSFQHFSGKENVLKVEDNKCYITSTGVFWNHFQLPKAGRYRILVEAQNIQRFSVSRTSGSPVATLFDTNKPEPNFSTTEFDMPQDAFALNILGNDDGNAYVSKIMVIDADKWDDLKSIMSSENPYFDYRTMPITIK